MVDEVFTASPFLDPYDLVQVKYEMVRRVRVDKVPVARAAPAFGFCRQSFYAIAARAGCRWSVGPGAGQAWSEGPSKLTGRSWSTSRPCWRPIRS
ncbi:hypothetical protein BOG92_054490 [Streptomyces sp. WAC00263]|nr:hypothetical protein BOG92_054490 [Streptomyces sp. WAC00263]